MQLLRLATDGNHHRHLAVQLAQMGHADLILIHLLGFRLGVLLYMLIPNSDQTSQTLHSRLYIGYISRHVTYQFVLIMVSSRCVAVLL